MLHISWLQSGRRGLTKWLCSHRQELRKAADEVEQLRGEVADQEGLFLQISEAKQEADELRDQLAAATQVGPERVVTPTDPCEQCHDPVNHCHATDPAPPAQLHPCCSGTVVH
jgi:hypothetical protein